MALTLAVSLLLLLISDNKESFFVSGCDFSGPTTIQKKNNKKTLTLML
jgi:hypothetical protein